MKKTILPLVLLIVLAGLRGIRIPRHRRDRGLSPRIPRGRLRGLQWLSRRDRRRPSL